MPIIRCDNPVLEKALFDLHAMILKYGGYINDNVTVQEKQGELSILSSLPEDNQEDLIILPDACLPRIGDFVITAHDEKLIAEPKSHDIKESHTTLMRLMIEIYNITNKLSKHRDTNPWLSLEKSPSLMQKLFEGRAMDPKMRQYYSVVETLNDGGVSESIARSVKTLVVLQLDKLHNYMNRINSLG